MIFMAIYILCLNGCIAVLTDSEEQADSPIIYNNYDIEKMQSQARYDHRLISKEIKNNKFSTPQYGTSCFILTTEYHHGQQIKRRNNCEVCLCLDGEIFCWWKKCINRKKKKIQKDYLKSKKKYFKNIKAPKGFPHRTQTRKEFKNLSHNQTMLNENLHKQIAENNTLLFKNISDFKNASEIETKIKTDNNETNTTTENGINLNENSVNDNSKCLVMGISYNIGDILPQATGNCLQCECTESLEKNESPRITCSPKNCPPLILPDLLDDTEF